MLDRWLGPRRARLKALSDRLDALEAAFPRYDLAMDGIVDECRDLLERTERMRGRAAADRSAANRLRGVSEGEPVEEGGTPSRSPAVLAAASRLRALTS